MVCRNSSRIAHLCVEETRKYLSPLVGERLLTLLSPRTDTGGDPSPTLAAGPMSSLLSASGLGRLEHLAVEKGPGMTLADLC